MRQHEQIERTAAAADVRHHGRSSRVAAAPRASRVDENPVAVRRAQRDRVALPDVDHVQLELAVRARGDARRRDRQPDEHHGGDGRDGRRRAPVARRAGDDERRRQHARRSRRKPDVGATRTDAPGVAAATVATRSRPPSSGCAASASSVASGWIGASSMPTNSIGCASARSGVATRLVSGATRLIRPNTHATIGADADRRDGRADEDQRAARARATEGGARRFARATRAAAIIDVTPTTLSW